MRTVYKYTISRVGGTFKTVMDYVPRHVGIDSEGQLCLWLEVDTNRPPLKAEAKVLGTGHEIDFSVISVYNIFVDSIDENGFEFAGTAIESNGLVWHVYLR